MTKTEIEKLGLGTVQFGLNYGISNQGGKTPDAEAIKIIHRAKEFGVNLIDTANSYGDSEEVIGKSGASNNFKIITKVPSLSSEERTIETIERYIVNSLSNLKLKSLYGLLFHDSKSIDQNYSFLSTYLKEKKLVGKVGVSVYDPQECFDICSQHDVDIVQLPLNIFDQRFEKTGCIQYLKEKGIEVHTRSAFLQGSLLMSTLPYKLRHLEQKHNLFKSFCAKAQKSMLSISLGYPLSIPGVDQVIVGVNTLDHFEEIIQTDYSFEMSPKQLDGFSIENEAIVNPANWG